MTFPTLKYDNSRRPFTLPLAMQPGSTLLILSPLEMGPPNSEKRLQGKGPSLEDWWSLSQGMHFQAAHSTLDLGELLLTQ